MRRQGGVLWTAAAAAAVVGSVGCCSLKFCQEKGQSPVVIVGEAPELPLQDVYISKKAGQQMTWVLADGRPRRVVVTLAGNPRPFDSCVGDGPTCTITCSSGPVCHSGPIRADVDPPRTGYRYEYEIQPIGGGPGADPVFIIKP